MDADAASGEDEPLPLLPDTHHCWEPLSDIAPVVLVISDGHGLPFAMACAVVYPRGVRSTRAHSPDEDDSYIFATLRDLDALATSECLREPGVLPNGQGSDLGACDVSALGVPGCPGDPCLPAGLNCVPRRLSLDRVFAGVDFGPKPHLVATGPAARLADKRSPLERKRDLHFASMPSAISGEPCVPLPCACVHNKRKHVF